MKQLVQLFIALIIFGTQSIAYSQSCNPACQDLLEVALDDDNEAKILLSDVEESNCDVDYKFSISTIHGEEVFSTTDPDVAWIAGADHRGLNYIYILHNIATENECWGKISVEGQAINEDCELVCAGIITAQYFADEVQIFTDDLHFNACTAILELTITDDTGAEVHSTTERSDPWDVQEVHADRTFDFILEHVSSGATCNGEIQIQQFEAADCTAIPADLSLFEIPATMEFTDKTQGQVLEILRNQYNEALVDALLTQGITNNNFNYAWTYQEKAVIDRASLILDRDIEVIDWCTTTTITRNQVITITKPSAMNVSSIMFGQTDKAMTITSAILQNEAGQSAFLNLEENDDLITSINKTIENQDWTNKNVSLAINKDEDCKAGLSVTDMVQVVNHILGTKELKNNTAYLAADYNDDGNVTATDLVGMLNTMLDKIDCGGDSNWRFYKDAINKISPSALTKLRDLSDFDLSYALGQDANPNTDITSFKKGDVNQSALDKKVKSRSVASAKLVVEDIAVKAGQTYDVQFKLTDDATVVAGDVSIRQNKFMDVIGFDSDYASIGESDYSTDHNDAHLLIYRVVQNEIETDQAIFTMKIRSHKNGRLSDILSEDDVTIELYESAEANAGGLYEINFEEVEENTFGTEEGYIVYSNGSELLVKSINTSTAALQSVALYNMSGQQFFLQQNMNDTNASIPVNQNPGMITYQLISVDGTIQTGKLFTF